MHKNRNYQLQTHQQPNQFLDFNKKIDFQTNSQNKIIHQINNQGCQCSLCQKIVINQMKVIQRIQIKDSQSQFSRKKQQYFSKFLLQYFYIDKLNRKVKIHLPEICIFQKGNPIYLLSKKKQVLPLKLIKNKQKLNAFQIQNFFMDGYIFHNNLKQNEDIMKNHKIKTLSKQYYKFDEYLKNQCIVLVKFINGTNQMMTPVQLNNLFKSKQKHVRSEIENITTMVCNSNYNQIRIRLNIENIEKEQRSLKSSFSASSLNLNNVPLLQRAKNQVKIINQHIKPKDFMYVSQKQERKFQDNLKSKDQKKYLEYISMKMILLHSLRTGTLLNQTLFKFMKDQNGDYYLIDIQAYEKQSSSKLWGQYQKIPKKEKSPEKKRKRPASSPEKLMCNIIKTQTNQEVQKVVKEDIFLNNKVKYYQEQDLIRPITVLHMKSDNEDKKQLLMIQNKKINLNSKNVIKSNENRENRQRGISMREMKQIKKQISSKAKASSQSFFKLQPIKRSKFECTKEPKSNEIQNGQNCNKYKINKDASNFSLCPAMKMKVNTFDKLQVKLL